MRYAIMGATVEQVRSVGGTDIKETRRTGIIFATLTTEQADQLRSMGCQVTEVGQVQAIVVPPIVTPPVPVAAAPIYSPEQLTWAAGYDEMRSIVVPPLYGEGFNLAIIDTGILETHEKINGRVVYRKNYTSDPMRDGLNHGTGVCSIALAVAPLCNILNLKVLDDKGSGSEEDVILAIDDCIDLHDTRPDIAPSVINLSLGAPDDGNPNNPMRVACRAAIDRDIWVFASAGNDGPAVQSITSPACEKYVFAVGSISYEPFAVSAFSSRGPSKEGYIKPDGVTFGENLIMASSSGDTATIAKSGTSFATPFGSGLAIIYHEGVYRQAEVVQRVVRFPPGAVPRVSVKELIDTYVPLACIKPEGAAAGKDCDYGWGLPYGPFAFRALGLAPAIDISALLTGVVAIGMIGVVTTSMASGMSSMIKGVK